MDDWQPRPHDHLVEPVFGGLGARHDRDPYAADAAPASAARRRLWIGVALALAAVAARAAWLLAR